MPVANCSTDAEAIALDKISFGDWLRQKGFTSERLFWYCDYATRDDYGLKLDQTSAWAGLFYFCSRVRKSGEESQSFITFPEGNGRFVNFLAGKIKDKIRVKTIALEIIPNETGVDIIYLNTETNEIRGLHCEKAIFAAPIFTAKYLIRDFKTNPPTFVNEFQHNAWFVANLFLKDRPKIVLQKIFRSRGTMFYTKARRSAMSTQRIKKALITGRRFSHIITRWRRKTTVAPNFSRSNGRQLADIVLSDLSMAHKDIRAADDAD